MSTYTPLASATLTDPASSVTIGNIPQTYTDLVAVIEGIATSAFGQIQMRLNDDTGTNYSTTYMWGTGSAAQSDRDSNISTGGFNPGFIGTGRGTTIINVQNYSNSVTYKSVVARSSVAGNRVAATVNLWRSTAAVNQIRFNILGGDTFASTTTFNLYGIKAE